jgi:hypothetical protein
MNQIGDSGIPPFSAENLFIDPDVLRMPEVRLFDQDTLLRIFVQLPGQSKTLVTACFQNLRPFPGLERHTIRSGKTGGDETDVLAHAILLDSHRHA